jgi:folate-binding protein YgfZ
MNADWRAFLEARGAHIAPDRGALFGNAADRTEPGCALVDLSELGLIAIAGPDAMDYLQGQVSNDLRELSDSHSQFSSHCSAKGRMLANFRVLSVEDSLFLVLPRAQLPALLKRLRMFVLRAKVQIDDASDALVCAGIIGDCADATLAAVFGSLPDDANGLARHQQTTLVRVAGPTTRWLLIGPAEQVEPIWASAAARAAEADPELWALYDIRAGIPVIRPETSDAFIPQMTNMQLIDGVSFHKGCYTGQEVVARMQYLGKLKRRMYNAEVETDATPRAGDPLFVSGSRSEQASDRIVDARQVGPGRWELLVVVEITAAEDGEVRLSEEGPALKLTPPPYGFPVQPAPEAAGSSA